MGQEGTSGKRRPRVTRSSDVGWPDDGIHSLWRRYWAMPNSRKLRNKLIAYYLPDVERITHSLIQKATLIDREDAMGEALALLTERIVPQYRGRIKFSTWAYTCIRRRLIDMQRRTKRFPPTFSTDHQIALGMKGLATGPRFHELTASLTDRQATVLWLIYGRNMSVEGVAKVLSVSCATIRRIQRCALARLRSQQN